MKKANHEKRIEKHLTGNAGTTLIEMIVCFALLAIFVTAAASIIASTTNLYYQVKGETYSGQVSDILLEKILEEKGSDTTVAIIAPYRAQVGLLRRSCKKTSNTKIDTVDGFQGKESDIVIFSVTRTMGSYRFLADERRLNVALSRAKDKIYIVGEKNYGEKEHVLKKIIERSTVEEYTI